MIVGGTIGGGNDGDFDLRSGRPSSVLTEHFLRSDSIIYDTIKTEYFSLINDLGVYLLLESVGRHNNNQISTVDQ